MTQVTHVASHPDLTCTVYTLISRRTWGQIEEHSVADGTVCKCLHLFIMGNVNNLQCFLFHHIAASHDLKMKETIMETPVHSCSDNIAIDMELLIHHNKAGYNISDGMGLVKGITCWCHTDMIKHWTENVRLNFTNKKTTLKIDILGFKKKWNKATKW